MIAPKITPRIISIAVKAAIAPTLYFLNVQAAYWQTWHSVFREVK